MTHVLASSQFRWQGAYSAFSVCTDSLATVCAYIEDQKRHHARNTIRADWEIAEG